MTRVHLIVLAVNSIFLLGCDGGKSGNSDLYDDRSSSLSDTEIQNKQYYEKIENSIRSTLGITDQEKIDKIMQSLIDDEEIGAPFIVKKLNGRPEIHYLSYVEYKRYRSTHEIDTANTFTFEFHIDTLKNIEDSLMNIDRLKLIEALKLNDTSKSND